MFASLPIPQDSRRPEEASRGLVWIVDDSALEAEAVRRALEPELDTEVFHDGSAVLERSIHSPLPDVLVIDWLMPGVTGVDVCRFLRSKSDRLPVLLLTVQGDKQHLVEGLAAGANDFVAKPFSPVELSARVRALLATRRLHERAERAERARADAAEERARLSELYLGIIGHDLRNPLAAISTAASLLTARSSDEQSRYFADRIRSSSRRMTEMIGALLDLTRSRLGGGLPVHPKRNDVRKLVAQLVDELAGAYPDREILLDAPPTPIELEVDADRLGQVVSNLVSNGLMHGRPDAPVEVVLGRTATEVRLTVINQGPPMSREIIEHLFDPFRRGTVPPVGPGGLGLGLYITQQIVAAHGGTIEVTSDQVTSFTVKLPYK